VRKHGDRGGFIATGKRLFENLLQRKLSKEKNGPHVNKKRNRGRQGGKRHSGGGLPTSGKKGLSSKNSSKRSGKKTKVSYNVKKLVAFRGKEGSKITVRKASPEGGKIEKRRGYLKLRKRSRCRGLR